MGCINVVVGAQNDCARYGHALGALTTVVAARKVPSTEARSKAPGLSMFFERIASHSSTILMPTPREYVDDGLY
jgi:hypothetical protein